MTSIRTLALLFALMVSAQAPGIAHAAGNITPIPKLKPAVTVVGELVRIGDLFEDAGEHADIALFRAPDLGQTGSVATADVIAALRRHDIYLYDTAGLAQVTVTHASRAVAPKEIEARLAAALAGRHGLGAAADLSVTFDQALPIIHVEAAAKGKLRVLHLHYDRRTTRFGALIDLPDSAMLRQTPLRLSGTAVETIEMVLATRRVTRGEVLKEADLLRERRPRHAVAADIVTDITGAIGLAVRRPLRAGAQLRHADLMKPEVVQRNDAVTLVYEAPGIMLSTRGKALEAGAKGDLVSVENLQSKRTVHATVTGPGRVTVAAHAMPAAIRPAQVAAKPPARAAHPAARIWRPTAKSPRIE